MKNQGLKKFLRLLLPVIIILFLAFTLYGDLRQILLGDADLSFFLETDISDYLSGESMRHEEHCVIERQTDDVPQLRLNALSAALTDASNGRLLYSRSPDDELPMASTTKIMTCIYTLQNSDPDDVVTFSKYAASMPDVQLGAKEGEQFYLRDLLYSLMLESHNDTAVAIAEHVSGSVESFCQGMTDLAREIGAQHTSFKTPNGLDKEGHYTTAADLCLIGAYALKNDEFTGITNTPSHSFKNLAGTRSYSVSNKNSFLQMMDGAIGIKTGFTGKAGYCFVGALKAKGSLFISSVLACGWPPHKTYKWSDTRSLMGYAVSNFSKQNIYDGKTQKPLYIPVLNGKARSVKLLYPDYMPELSLLLAGWEEVTVEYSIPNYLSAPVAGGAPVGSVSYLIDGKPYKSYDVYAAETVDIIDYGFLLHKLLSHLL